MARDASGKKIKKMKDKKGKKRSVQDAELPESPEPQDEGEETGAPGEQSADDGSTDPYGAGAIPEVVDAQEMGDENFLRHLGGRHTHLLKGQNPDKMHAGAALRPYYGAHLREHNAGAGFDPHTHADAG
jgi:hypothetical protein